MSNENHIPVPSALSRRRLLTTAGAAGVAVGTASVVGIAVTASNQDDGSTRSTSGKPGDEHADGPIVVHVRDLSTGALDVFVGTAHHQIRDRDLARALASAARV